MDKIEVLVEILENSCCNDPFECIFGMYGHATGKGYGCFAKYPDSDPRKESQGCIAHQAANILKTLVPRLLTLDDLRNAKNIDVYLEEKCETQTHPLRLVETENESMNQAAFFWPSIVRPLKSYGKTWRCWTARPTDEQREATKWDE